MDTDTDTATTYTAADPFGPTLGLSTVRRHGRHGWIAGHGTGYTQWEVRPTRNVALAESDAPHFWTAIVWSNGMPFRTVEHALGGPVSALAAVLGMSGSPALIATLAPALQAEHDRYLDRVGR